MLSKKEAKEMAKYIVLGVNHYDDIKDKTSHTLSVLEKYNLVEKTKVGDKVMGSARAELERKEPEEESDFEQEVAL